MRFSLAAALLFAAVPVFAASPELNVLDFGASPDGRTKDTAAIAKAVDAVHAAGGGTLVFPPGKYLTGSIHLVDNLTLRLEAGAELLYSPDPADSSPLVPGRWESTAAFTYSPLIYAYHCQNVAITGQGTLNGQGANWWWRSAGKAAPERKAEALPAMKAWLKLYDRIEAGEKLQAADFKVAADYLRPNLVQFNGCKNVVVEGVTLTESPMWLLHPLFSENVEIRGVHFISTGVNGDGVDIDSSRDVRISDCFFSTGDDCIVIKSGRDEDGRRVHQPTEHVVVTNCVMYNGHGAIVIGSETSGDIRDIAASNIVAKGTWMGVRIKSQRGRGGIIENMRFSNFVIEDAPINAIEITARYEKQPAEKFSERTPIFRNLSFSNFTIIRAHQVASILGIDEQAIHQLRFSDIKATGEKGFICDIADDVELHNVRVDATSGSEFSFSHARDLVFDDVGSHVPNPGAAVVKLLDSDNIWLRSSHAVAGTGVFLEVVGAKPSRLKLTGNELDLAQTPISPVN